MDSTEAFKKKVQEEIDVLSERLFEISDWMYENPEYGCEEFEASRLISEELRKHGFTVEKPFIEIPTAFKAVFKGKKGGPKIAVLGEYDALEGIGHGCAHNIIGTAALGAGIAISKVMKEIQGELIVLGCPAEENRKGGPPGGWPCQSSKAIMCAQGVFEDIDAAMMIHPGTGITQINRGTLISQYLEVVFRGRTAHAAGGPWDGRNAMQAAVLFINGVNAMRQQFRRGPPYIPVTHWIITEAGTAGNIIPDLARCYGGIRSQDTDYLKELLEMVENCAKGAALMTGCEAELNLRPGGGIHTLPRSEESKAIAPNLYLTELMYQNLLELGVETEDWRITARKQPGGGTDFSNVSRRVPGIHPMLSLSQERFPGHSIALAEATASEEGHKCLINGAKALAMTAIDVFTVPSNLEKTKSAHLMEIDEYLSHREKWKG
jgi:amidohydrolase